MRRVVGARTRQAAERAAERATTVYKVIDLEERGFLVVGEYPAVSASALATRSDVGYVERDRKAVALAQRTPWGIDRIDADAVVFCPTRRFSAVQTYRGGQAVVTRQQSVSTTGFDCHLQEEEALGSHTIEVVGYLAVEQGSGRTEHPSKPDRPPTPSKTHRTLSTSPKPTLQRRSSSVRCRPRTVPTRLRCARSPGTKPAWRSPSKRRKAPTAKRTTPPR